MRSCECHYLTKLSWLPSQKKASVRLPTDSMSLVGVEKLKNEKSQAIRSFVSGRGVFVALPTGYGKSFCYALRPLVFVRLRAATHKSIVICVSPLTALVADQQEKFTTKGIAVEFVGELQQYKLIDAMCEPAGVSLYISALSQSCEILSGARCFLPRPSWARDRRGILLV